MEKYQQKYMLFYTTEIFSCLTACNAMNKSGWVIERFSKRGNGNLLSSLAGGVRKFIELTGVGEKIYYFYFGSEYASVTH